jgi:hypothetical protein
MKKSFLKNAGINCFSACFFALTIPGFNNCKAQSYCTSTLQDPTYSCISGIAISGFNFSIIDRIDTGSWGGDGNDYMGLPASVSISASPENTIIPDYHKWSLSRCCQTKRKTANRKTHQTIVQIKTAFYEKD